MMKKLSLVMVMILAATLGCFLAGCGESPAEANIFVEVPQGQTATWHPQTPPVYGLAFSPAYYIQLTKIGSYLAVLTDFSVHSDQHPSLNQEKDSLEQTLQFTLVTGSSWDTKTEAPDVIVRANGEILPHISAEKSVRQINPHTETVDGVEMDAYDNVEVWCFTYEQGGYTADVTLTFEGLVQIA